MKKCNVLLLLLPLLVPHLLAILDGRRAPVFVNTAYTFTNYEWARGEVYFRSGFVVPPNITAILGVTVPVVGEILLCAGGDDSTPSTIMLETPLDIGSATLKGGCTFKTKNNIDGYLLGFSGCGDRLVFEDNMRLDMQGRSVAIDLATNGPLSTQRFVINNASPKKLTLVNGCLQSIYDFPSVEPRMFVGKNTAGRHELVLENVALLLGQQGLLTFTNLNVTCSSGSAIFQGPYRASNINFYSELNIGNDAMLTGMPSMQFNLTSSITSNDYLQVAPRGKLVLNSNTLTYNRPLRLPFPVPNADTHSRIVINGSSTIQANGVGSNRILQLGAGPVLTYTCDASLEIMPSAHLILDNVILQNKSFFD
jgi:hypothetical protein